VKSFVDKAGNSGEAQDANSGESEGLKVVLLAQALNPVERKEVRVVTGREWNERKKGNGKV